MDKIELKKCLICGSEQYKLLFSLGSWPFRQCNECHFVFLGVQPDWSSKKIINQQRYTQSLGLGSAAKRRMQERDDRECLNQINKYSQKGLLLDIGCATGDLLTRAREHGWAVFGVELDPNLAAAAAKKVRSENIHVGTSSDCPFPRNRFDAIVMRSVLEHIPDPRAELARVRTFMRPNGCLFIVVPNIESFESKLYGSRWFALTPGDHLWFFSPSTLRHLLQESGFSVVWMSTMEAYRDMFVGALFALWWIMKDTFHALKKDKKRSNENLNERSTGFFAVRFPSNLLRSVDTLMEVSRILIFPFFFLYSRMLQAQERGASIWGIFVRTQSTE